MIRIILLLAIVSTAFVGSLDASTVHPNKAPAEKPPLEVYVPPGWKLDAPFAIDYRYSARALLVSHGSKGERVTCHVTFTERTDPGFRRLDEQGQVISQLQNSRDSFMVLETTPMTIRNRPAKRLTASWRNAGSPMKGALYFVEKDQRKVVLECASSAGGYKRNLPVFDQIASRLEIH